MNHPAAAQKHDPRVTDGRSHMILCNISQAQRALVNLCVAEGRTPSWWSGSFVELRDLVVMEVRKRFPDVRIPDALLSES